MTESDTNRTTSQQWLKKATIPLLLLVLVAVLLWPSAESDAAVEPIALTRELSQAAAAQTTAETRTKWPKASLDDVIAFSPFEPQPKADPEQDRERALLELANQPGGDETTAGDEPSKSSAPVPRHIPLGKLQAIYFDTRGGAALLDSKVFRVGDTLPDGRRIAEITAEGIRLEGT